MSDINDIRPAAVEAGQTFEAVRSGAPPQYTKAVHEIICENIKKGARDTVAARMAGIPSNIFYRWINMGRSGDPRFYDFAIDVDQALAIFESRMVEKVVEDAETDAKSAQWTLERRFPEGYSKEVEAKVQGIMTAFMEALKEQLTDAEFFKVLAITSGFSASEQPAKLLNVEPKTLSECAGSADPSGIRETECEENL